MAIDIRCARDLYLPVPSVLPMACASIYLETASQGEILGKYEAGAEWFSVSPHIRPSG